MSSEEDWRRVAAQVRQRRNAKGWTQMDVATRGGLSLDRVQSIEGVRSTRYSARTVAAIERALEWQQGSVSRILSGGDPVRVTGVAASEPGSDLEELERGYEAALRDPEMREALLTIFRRMSPSASDAHDSAGHERDRDAG